MTASLSKTGGKGYSLHIGINRLSPDSSTYQLPGENLSQSHPELQACENDAKAYAKLAGDFGFSSINLLLGEDATTDNFRTKMAEFAALLKPEDLLFISFSGHGGRVPDTSGDEPDDGLDEVWCFYDSIILDDELFERWGEFRSGVRIIVVSDSCHSGDILKADGELVKPNGRPMFSCIPDKTSLPSSVQLMAACREDQLTRETFNSTKDIWHGAFSNCLINRAMTEIPPSYPKLFEAVKECIRGRQHPRRQLLGQSNPEFFNGRIFEI